MSDNTAEEIVEDIQEVARQLGVSSLSIPEYIKHGRYSYYYLWDGGRTWEELCIAAGVQTKKKEEIPDEVYFERLKKAVETLGRYPKTSERKRFGLNFRKTRYPTLDSFIQAAIDKGVISPSASATERAPEATRSEVEYHPSLKEDEQVVDSPGRREVPPIPAKTRRRNWQRTGVDGFPYAPQDELGLVALLAVLCSQRLIPWQVVELNGGKGIDGVCYDDEHHCEVRVELKHTLSRSTWNHPVEDLDYVVCWENRWPDFPKTVIELRKMIEKLNT